MARHRLKLGNRREVACAECGQRVLRRPRHGNGHRIKRYFCGLACKAAWQRSQHPVSNEWLRKKYVTDGLSAVDIAVLVRRDAKSVWNWLRGAGIQTRQRGQDQRQWFKNGRVSPMKGKHHTKEARKKMRRAAIARGLPSFLRNGRVPYMRGRKGSLAPQWKGGVTPERQAFYSTEEWKTVREALYLRATGRCERCGSPKTKVMPLHAHHIVSFAVRELRATLSNLALLCKQCHLFVHSNKNVNREFLPKEVA